MNTPIVISSNDHRLMLVAANVVKGFMWDSRPLLDARSQHRPYFKTIEVYGIPKYPDWRIFENTGFNFLLICENILVGTTGSGIGCGGPGLNWVGDTPPGSYDEEDDNIIIIKVLDNVDGGCGLPAAEPMTLRLTKIN